MKFDDGIKWNKFCKLRTNLIKKNFESIDMTQINLNLNINKQKVDEIAECLRLEFEYSVTTRPEFQKLVILAIQSIRRNLIRAQNNKQIKLKKN